MHSPRLPLTPPWWLASFVASVLALVLTPFLRARWGEAMVEVVRIGVLAPVAVLMLASAAHAGVFWRRAALGAGALVGAALLSWGAFWPSFAGLALVFGGIGAGFALARLLAAGDEAARARAALWWFLGLLGAALAAWLWLEDRLDLWKRVPTTWELIKNLEYKEGIRHGLGRSRAVFGHSTGAAVWQWFTGTLLLVAAWGWIRSHAGRVAAAAAGLVCLSSIAPTLARAGVLLAGFSALAVAAQFLRWGNRRRIALLGLAAGAALLAAAAVHRFAVRENRPWLRSFSSIASVGATGNAERLDLMWLGLATLPDVPWRGRGLDSITPRFPEAAQVNFETTTLSIVHALGAAGAAVSAAFIGFFALAGWRCWLHPDRGRDQRVQLALLVGPAFLAYSFTAPCLWYWEQAFVLWCAAGVLLAALAPRPDPRGPENRDVPRAAAP